MNFDELKSAAKKLSTQDRSRLLTELANSLSRHAWPHSEPTSIGASPRPAVRIMPNEASVETADEHLKELAGNLPEWVAPHWRSPERWRRLSENRLAGQQLHRLNGLFSRTSALNLLEEIKALPMERQDNTYLRGGYYQPDADEVRALLPDFASGAIRELFGATLGKVLPSRMFLRAFQLQADDLIAEHVDGEHYAATFTIGLCDRWSSAQGGAIAFGENRQGTFHTQSRWLPHLGDVLVFVTSKTLAHRVEPVAFGERFTLTGQYVSASYPG